MFAQQKRPHLDSMLDNSQQQSNSRPSSSDATPLRISAEAHASANPQPNMDSSYFRNNMKELKSIDSVDSVVGISVAGGGGVNGDAGVKATAAKKTAKFKDIDEDEADVGAGGAIAQFSPPHSQFTYASVDNDNENIYHAPPPPLPAHAQSSLSSSSGHSRPSPPKTPEIGRVKTATTVANATTVLSQTYTQQNRSQFTPIYRHGTSSPPRGDVNVKSKSSTAIAIDSTSAAAAAPINIKVEKEPTAEASFPMPHLSPAAHKKTNTLSMKVNSAVASTLVATATASSTLPNTRHLNNTSNNNQNNNININSNSLHMENHTIASTYNGNYNFLLLFLRVVGDFLSLFLSDSLVTFCSRYMFLTYTYIFFVK